MVITKKIIELHKGKITYSSKLNEGTTFTFSIPIYIDPKPTPKFDHSPFANYGANLKSDKDNNSDTKAE